jgi:Transglycosylase SLT domain
LVTRRRRRLIPLVAAILVMAAVGGFLNREDNSLPGDLPSVPTPPGARTDEERTPLPDPFAYDPERREEFEQRAAAGTSHALYARSPGGVLVTAERVKRFRSQIEAAAKAAGVDPNRLEALVFLESAGRSDAIASDTEGAVGLTQILAETGQNLLGMKIDVAKSRHYSRRIRRELLRAHLNKVRELQRARAKVDQRFDPAQALAATARYLRMAKERFKREDMAFVSYHMGMGNLMSVLRAYGVEPGDEDVPYAQVYFDSSPIRHGAAYAKLFSFGDDSSNYLWKLGAAERIMELSRHDTGKLAALQAAQTAKASSEEVLHPPGTTERFATPEQLQQAWEDDDLVAFPENERVTGLKGDPRMGELGRPRSLYRGLRPEALATALYIGAEVRALSGQAPLVVTSTVRDEAYQKRLVARNGEATRGYSLHTTGWAFDIAREYRSKVHARAFQFVLDRLQVLDAIAWVREPNAIHVTAARDGEALLPLLKRIQPTG